MNWLLCWPRLFERHFKPFSDDEAWLIFRLSAYGEALGWTLLILGIGLKYTMFHGNDSPVLVAGRIHGTLFIVYMVICILTYPSQKWSRWLVIVALAASVPPYGSVIFERLIAVGRQFRSARQQLALNLYRLCIKI